jgi:predicted DNA-binding transcriptional regulator YafY
MNHFHKSGELVEMIYISSDGNITQRVVRVYRKTSDKIYGYCFLRKGFRSFRKEQILAMLPKKKYGKSA